MPTVLEHTAHQLSPARFTRFKRVHPGAWPAGVDAVLGVTKDGSEELQSVRFISDKWPAERARSWLSVKGFTAAGFAPAGSPYASAPASVVQTKQAPVDLVAHVEVVKLDQDKQQVFGWLYVCRRKDGSQVVDHSGEIVKVETLEAASYDFVLNSRMMDTMHDWVGAGRLIECCMFTAEKRKAMGIPDGILPDGMWVGFKVDNSDTWLRIKSGELRMFSLGGKAILRALKRLA